MAKGYKSGVSNLPAGLKIVGNPRPSFPKEGIVWVNTDVEITGYYLSATQPENLVQGNVWVKISDSFSNEIGTSFGNDYITIILDSVMQYVNGALVYKEAKSWKGGKWADWWNGTLYEPGNTYDHITGGWGLLGQFDSYIDGTFSINADSLSVTASGTNGKGCNFTHYKKVDLTYYSLLSFEASTNVAGRANVVIADAINHYITILNLDTTSRKKYTIDLSNIKGEHYIAIGVWFSETASGRRIDVYNIKLIR